MSTPIDTLLDRVQWEDVDPPEDLEGLPYMTHRGELNIGGLYLQCAVLSNGKCIFYGEEIEAMMGILGGAV